MAVQTNQGSILRVCLADFDETTANAFIHGLRGNLKKIFFTYNVKVDIPLMRPGYQCVEIWLPWVNDKQYSKAEHAMVVIAASIYHGIAELSKKSGFPDGCEAYTINIDRDVEWEARTEPIEDDAP